MPLFFQKGEDLFDFRTMDEIDCLKDPRFLLEGILPEQTFCLLHGQPGLGKSLLATSWGYHLSYGIPWHGLKAVKAFVLNILTEGHDGDIKKRQKAWKITNKKRRNNSEYLWMQQPVNLFTGGQELDRLLENLCKFRPEIVSQNRTSPLLVILDTLQRCSSGADENAPKDMSRIIESVFYIKTQLNCVILLVHHPPKDNPRTARGHSSLTAAADVVLSLQGSPTDPNCLLACDKNKGGRLFELAMVREEVETSYGTSAIIRAYQPVVDFTNIRRSEPEGFFQVAELFKGGGILTVKEIQQELEGQKERSQIYRDLKKLQNINIIRQLGKGEYALVQ